MICENCKKQKATTRLTTYIGGKQKNLNLCANCAAKMTGGSNLGGLDSLFSSFFGRDFDLGGLMPEGNHGQFEPTEQVDIAETYSEDTKKLIHKAKQIAATDKNQSADTEHLLFALTEDKLGQKILKNLGADIAKI